jgi:hypothetical protein
MPFVYVLGSDGVYGDSPILRLAEYHDWIVICIHQKAAVSSFATKLIQGGIRTTSTA